MHLDNHPDNKNPHNIDLHAVNGPGGGAAASLTAPGHSSVFTFKALNPGLYVYHCATAPVAMHVANGMYGLILVEPKEGLPKVDHEYYLMQGDFYTQGANGEQGLQPFSMAKAIDEKPDYVVFNGSVGSTVGDKALAAKVGETVRLFVGDGGPNLDLVVPRDRRDLRHRLAGGQSQRADAQRSDDDDPRRRRRDRRIQDERARHLHHRRSFARRAPSTAAPSPSSRSAATRTSSSIPARSTISSISRKARASRSRRRAAVSAPAAKNKAERIEAGAAVFANNCQACHQANGEGVPDAFPPLAESDYLNGDKIRAIKTVTGGLESQADRQRP